MRLSARLMEVTLLKSPGTALKMSHLLSGMSLWLKILALVSGCRLKEAVDVFDIDNLVALII